MFLMFTFATTLFCVVTSVCFATSSKKINLFQSKANQTEYDLVLDSSNAPSGLTSTYQREVTSTVNTTLGNSLTFKINNATSLSGGYAKLGNHGTIYCSTDGNDHISGLMQINANFSNGSLKLISSYNNGPAFVTDEHILSSGVTYTLSDYANSFVLEAQDAYVDVVSISLKYTCSTNTKTFDSTKLFSIENYENYTATGVGYDANHSMKDQTNLRAAYYSVYKGSGTDPLNGSGWSTMGTSDYITYNSAKGRNGTKTALFKSNSGNYFMYVQRQYYFGVPIAIGQGKQLSLWMRGAYTGTDASTDSSYDAVVTIVAFYDKMLNTSGANLAASETFYVPAGSSWNQYTVDLNPSKPVYGYAIHIAKASGTIYLPVDDIEIYTQNPYAGNSSPYPTGTFIAQVSSYKLVFSFGTSSNSLIAIRISTTDVGPTLTNYNFSTNSFTISTANKVSGYTVGNITGTYDYTNDCLTNVNCSGQIGSALKNLTLTRPTNGLYFNSDGKTSDLRNTFLRRYRQSNSWSNDTSNSDRILSNTSNYAAGSSSLFVRPCGTSFQGYGFVLASDLSSAVTVNDLCFWVYNPCDYDLTLRCYFYKSQGYGNAGQVGISNDKAKANSWTYISRGFTQSAIYNFIISVWTEDNTTNQSTQMTAKVLFDDIFFE